MSATTETKAKDGVDGSSRRLALVRPPGGDQLPAFDERGFDTSTSAAEVVHAYLAKHAAALLVAEPRVRADEPDAVHDMRVAARRLRSTVQTFGPLFDQARAARVRAGLKEIGDVLSVPRDAEVQLARFLDELDEQPAELVLGPVRARIEQTLVTQRLRSHDAVLDYLGDERYRSFVDTLRAFVAEPCQTRRATRAAGKVLPKLVRRADRKLSRRVDRATQALPGPDRDAAHHSARKAAKRLRYACETLAPVYGARATRLGKHAKKVQNQLGEHQDCVVARIQLRQLGVAANLAGESSFTYGLLTGGETARAGRTLEQFATDWSAAARPRYRRWLRQ